MRFTKSDIEEIARRIAVITKRDSELPDAEIPLNDTERVPVIQYIPLVQDYENRLLSLADLRNLVLADVDQTAIGCVLKVTCQTTGASVSIKGVKRTTYTGYYGEMVDVIITTEGYDTWIGVVTMTQDHTLVVSLNKKGGDSPSPGPSPVSSYYVCLRNTQGATIEINGTKVASGSMNYFKAGDPVSWIVSLDGYDPNIMNISSIDKNYDLDITLPESSVDPGEHYLYFGKEAVEIGYSGGSGTVTLQSDVTWQISAADAPVAPEEGGEETAPTDEVPDSITAFVGETSDIISEDMAGKYTFKSKDTTVTTVSGNTVTGVSAGNTKLEVYDETGTYRQDVSVETKERTGGIVDVTGISLNMSSVSLKYVTARTKTLKATVSPSDATNKNVIWESDNGMVAQVSAKGVVTARNKTGVANITAYTFDRSHSATCKVSVTAQGTVVKSVTPSSVSIAAEGEAVDFVMTTDIMGGYDSGITVAGAAAGKTSNRATNSFTQTFPENWGNAREFNISVRGNNSDFNNEYGTVYVKVSQEGSSKVKGFKDYSSGTCHDNGTFYGGFAGALNYECALGAGQAMANAATSDSWITVDTSSAELFDLEGYTATQINEYKTKGTINGKDPKFQGKVATYSVSVSCAVNTGGQRIGYIEFPGGKKFKITQDAAS